MEIIRKYSKVIVIAIAIIMIVFGLVAYFFKLNIEKKTINDVGTGLLLAAAVIYFYGKKLQREYDANNKAEDKNEIIDEKSITGESGSNHSDASDSIDKSNETDKNNTSENKTN